jgi:hypothetical protein
MSRMLLAGHAAHRRDHRARRSQVVPSAAKIAAAPSTTLRRLVTTPNAQLVVNADCVWINHAADLPLWIVSDEPEDYALTAAPVYPGG